MIKEMISMPYERFNGAGMGCCGKTECKNIADIIRIYEPERLAVIQEENAAAKKTGLIWTYRR
ncbi:hypothetical protein H6503_00715 [Candidatus Woesearchaeota archaeon]|nr:hypothetical protein [Candidatus Woesearchaeota archaeon]